MFPFDDLSFEALYNVFVHQLNAWLLVVLPLVVGKMLLDRCLAFWMGRRL